MKKFIINISSFIFWVIIWEIIYLCIDARIVFASPFNVLTRIFQMLFVASTWISISSTFLRIMLGFILAMILGMSLAYIVKNNKYVEIIVNPFMNVIKIAPIVSFIILALVYIDNKYIVSFISFLMTLPIFYYNTISGMKSIDKNLYEMAKIYKLSKYEIYKHITLRGIIPYIKSAIESGVGFAWKAGITAEVLVLPKKSIGINLYNSKIYLDSTMLFSWTILTIIIGIIIEKLIVYLIKKYE